MEPARGLQLQDGGGIEQSKLLCRFDELVIRRARILFDKTLCLLIRFKFLDEKFNAEVNDQRFLKTGVTVNVAQTAKLTRF